MSTEDASDAAVELKTKNQVSHRRQSVTAAAVRRPADYGEHIISRPGVCIRQAYRGPGRLRAKLNRPPVIHQAMRDDIGNRILSDSGGAGGLRRRKLSQS
jgi:hypothetical protein